MPLKKSFSPKKWGFVRIFQPDFRFWQNPIFCAETFFFQGPLENFLLAWRTCSRYLKGPPNLALCVSKKIVTIRHTNEKILAKNRKKKRFSVTSLGKTVGQLESYIPSLRRYILFSGSYSCHFNERTTIIWRTSSMEKFVIWKVGNHLQHLSKV